MIEKENKVDNRGDLIRMIVLKKDLRNTPFGNKNYANKPNGSSFIKVSTGNFHQLFGKLLDKLVRINAN